VPADEPAASADGGSVPANDFAASADDHSASADGEAAPANTNSVPANDDVASENDDVASENADAASENGDATPANDDAASENAAGPLSCLFHTRGLLVMTLWNSGVTWNSGALWGPPAVPAFPAPQNTQTRRNTMQRANYYPALLAQRPEWHINFAAKLPIYGPTLGLTTAQINNAVADNLYLAHGLGDWISAVREFGPAATGALRVLESGTGGAAFAFTVFTAPTLPTLPAGVTEVLPGALTRTFGLVQVVKGLPGYTEAMGLDMGIVGSEVVPPPPGDVPAPELTATVIPGDANQYVRLKFFKRGHEYVVIESRRGAGAWEMIAQSNSSPYIDDRNLLAAGTAEVREYRARFWDDGTSCSDWCNVVKVTVGP